jgi:D-xylose transport system substrate-binding protein
MKNNLKTATLSLVILLCIFVLTGCGQTKAEPPQNDKIKIGFLMDSLVIERWQKDRDVFLTRAKELGAEVVIKNANEDPEIQIAQVKDCIEAGIDVIVIIPYDRTSIAPILKQARKSGIKVMAYDRLPENAGVDLYISFDNDRVGRLMAEHLVGLQPKGNYLLINGSPKDHNAYMFKEGYDAILKPYIASGDITIVSEVWAEDWREVYAYDAVNEILDMGGEIHAIIGANDDLAEGAIRSLLERQLAGQIPVAGHDANLSACQRIVEGTQSITIYKPIKNLAQRAAELAIALAEDQVIKGDELIFDGEFSVPFIKLAPYAVTAENMVEVIVDGGFHQLDEIYRNVPKAQWPKE